MSDFSRLLRCLHRWQQRAAVVGNTNLPMSKEDEWLDSRFGCCIPGDKAVVSI
jgi:hypothetical protein